MNNQLIEIELIKQGAEAKIYKCLFFNRPTIIKERFSKHYRISELDQKLTLKRMNQEIRCMIKCNEIGVKTPMIYFVDIYSKKIYFEYIEGITLKQYYQNNNLDFLKLNEKIGKTIAQIHDAGIIHGDLTTSNMLLQNSNQSLVMIDFGLSFCSNIIEDKAVDLYVLERAFLSTHPNSENIFQEILQHYSNFSKYSNLVIKKLEEVRLRGRKKLQIG
jgi:TP53 regulating kinase-like protein